MAPPIALTATIEYDRTAGLTVLFDPRDDAPTEDQPFLGGAVTFFTSSVKPCVVSCSTPLPRLKPLAAETVKQLLGPTIYQVVCDHLARSSQPIEQHRIELSPEESVLVLSAWSSRHPCL